jgi:site-specific DNA-methyltransferase (adenine-specific)
VRVRVREMEDYVRNDITLLYGDCLERLNEIEDNSIDLILSDLPYGIIARCSKWDKAIPFDNMWYQIERVIKDKSAICLFSMEPFSSKLRISNIELYKYDWYWIKGRPSGFVNAKLRPLNSVELINVFSKSNTANGSKNNMIYYPQGLVRVNVKHKNYKNNYLSSFESRKETHISEYANYPRNILHFDKDTNKTGHPTQKPVELLKYLIQTYTLEGETVLDFTMGSGSTGVACKELNRKFIGIEIEERYFDIAVNRIKETNIPFAQFVIDFSKDEVAKNEITPNRD